MTEKLTKAERTDAVAKDFIAATGTKLIVHPNLYRWLEQNGHDMSLYDVSYRIRALEERR